MNKYFSNFEKPFTMSPQYEFAHIYILCYHEGSVLNYGWTCSEGSNCPYSRPKLIGIATASVCVPIFSVALLIFLYVIMAYKRRIHPETKEVVWVKRKATYTRKCCKRMPTSLKDWQLKNIRKKEIELSNRR
jgi:hypothetical protein